MAHGKARVPCGRKSESYVYRDDEERRRNIPFLPRLELELRFEVLELLIFLALPFLEVQLDLCLLSMQCPPFVQLKLHATFQARTSRRKQ